MERKILTGLSKWEDNLVATHEHKAMADDLLFKVVYLVN